MVVAWSCPLPLPLADGARFAPDRIRSRNRQGNSPRNCRGAAETTNGPVRVMTMCCQIEDRLRGRESATPNGLSSRTQTALQLGKKEPATLGRVKMDLTMWRN